MIKIKQISGNRIGIEISGTLKEQDFKKITSTFDDIIKIHGRIRLFIDASEFDGWDNIKAVEKHLSFVKENHKHIERLAIIAGHQWQHWLGAVVSMFIDTEIRVFDIDQKDEAEEWIPILH